MTTPKRVLNPDRLRQVPEHFSWLDHRLVRGHYIEKADVCVWALYLFLLSVADVHGLSYYSDATLARRLRLPPERLALLPLFAPPSTVFAAVCDAGTHASH